MNQKSWELYSQILSQESVTLEYSKYADTASFNLDERKITLPIFEYMTDDVTQLLVSHEIGHALHSTYTTDEFKDCVNKYLDLFNVVEDAHIENRLKKSFNGLKIIFKDGYKALNEHDFFGLDEVEDIKSLSLTSRLNLFYKVGHIVNIPFEGRENEFAMRLKFVSSKDDVIKLCDDIIDYLKEEQKEEDGGTTNEDSSINFPNSKSSMKSEEETSEENNETNNDDNNSDSSKKESEFDEDDVNNSSLSESFKEEFDTSINDELTDIVGKTFNKKLTEYGETQRLKSNDFDTNSIVSLNSKFAYENAFDYTKLYSSIHKQAKSFITSPSCKKSVKEIKSLARSADIIFQQRKKAEELKNTKNVQIGRLNTKKLSKYRISDTIFSTRKIIKEGKNHGVVICVDYSGSMNKFLKDTITQACILGEFCKMNDIPFAIIAFGIVSSACFVNGQGQWTKNIAILGSHERFDIESILYLTYKNRLPIEYNGEYHNIHHYNTPTIDGLLAASYIIETFKKCGVEKTSLFLVTDGYHTGSCIRKDVGNVSVSHKVSSITVDNVLYSTSGIFKERIIHYDWIIELLCLNLKKRFDTFISISHLGFFGGVYASLSSTLLSKFPNINITSYNYYRHRENDEFLFLWKHGYYFEDCSKIPSSMTDGILSYSFKNNPFVDQFQFFDESSLDFEDENEIPLTKTLKRFKRLKVFVNAFIERFA